jgi:hypothetical protein
MHTASSGYGVPVSHDQPVDPFSGDPEDPAAELGDDDDGEPLSPTERDEVLADMEDLEVFRALLEPRGMRGLVVDCEDCREPHYFSWELLHGNLRHLLDVGQTRVHEPAFSPDPTQYVSWDYARGFADGVLDEGEEQESSTG